LGCAPCAVTDEEGQIQKMSKVLQGWRVLEYSLPHEQFRLRKTLSEQEAARLVNPIIGLSAARNRQRLSRSSSSLSSRLRTLGSGLRSLSRTFSRADSRRSAAAQPEPAPVSDPEPAVVAPTAGAATEPMPGFDSYTSPLYGDDDQGEQVSCSVL